jgi:gliding motility-associated-like protein
LQDGKTYYASQTENSCESPTRLGISVSIISTLPANNYEELFCDDLNDGTETVDLANYDSNIISNTTDYTFSYYTSLSGAENEATANKINDFSSYKLTLGDNIIYVRINSNTPCYAVAKLKLTLLSEPIIAIQDIVPICENNTITIDAGSGFSNYLWSNGATTQSIIVENSGDYWVTVTNNYDIITCSSTKKFTVKKSNIATITSLETQDWTDNQNTITAYVTGNGDYKYSIDGLNYQDSNVFSGLNSGNYTVLVRDKNGCGTATDEVYLLMFPKFFTPNGDGFNDVWKIKASDNEVGLTVKIFDRYGKLIKSLNSNTDSWNGTLNGQQLPATDYWFVVTRANGKEYKGHFSLKR